MLATTDPLTSTPRHARRFPPETTTGNIMKPKNSPVKPHRTAAFAIECQRSPELRVYLKSINQYRQLSQEEEYALARRAQAGDKAAFDEFVCCNLSLVVSCAKGYAGRGIDMLDLIQEGSIGLMKAARSFDPSRGL